MGAVWDIIAAEERPLPVCLRGLDSRRCLRRGFAFVHQHGSGGIHHWHGRRPRGRFFWVRAVVAAVIYGCSLFPAASGSQAGAFTDRVVFAAAAAGIPITTDNFSTYPLGDISNGQTLGQFTYTFEPNLSDPTGTQPTIGLDGANNVLIGGPFGGFVGGNSVTLTFTGGPTLEAFGTTFTYAPADEPLLADLYDLGILDCTGATTKAIRPASPPTADPSSPGLVPPVRSSHRAAYFP